MLFQDTKLLFNLLPNEISLNYITNNNKQFVKTVPLVYTTNNKTNELTFGLNESILLKDDDCFETFHILDSDYNVIVQDDIFEQFIDYIFSNVLFIEEWRSDLSVITRVLIFQTNISTRINLSSFANKLRKLFLAIDSPLSKETYQVNSDCLTSMFYSTTTDIEKANIIINIQESFSSSSVYINGIETYKKKTKMSGSFLNFQLSMKGELTRNGGSSNSSSSLTQWKDSTTWLTKARSLMMNFIVLNSYERDELKTYYNSHGLDYLTYKDRNLSFKINLDSLEEIKRVFLFDNYVVNDETNNVTVKSINSLLKDTFENGLGLDVQLLNKDTNEEGNEDKSSTLSNEEEKKIHDFIVDSYPTKPKSYAYKVVPSKGAVKINKIILKIAPTLLIIPHFESSIKKIINKYISDPSAEVIMEIGSDAWSVNNHFATNCNDKYMLLAFNKN